MSAPQPIASGDIASRPLEHLLLYVQQNELDGTLAIWPPERSEPGQDRLLFQQGRLRQAQLRASLPVLNGVLQLFERRSGLFAFYAEDVTTHAERVSIDTFALVAAGLRQFPSRGMAPLLRRFGTKHLRLKPHIQLARFNLNNDEQAVLQLLRAAPASVERLRQISGDPATADRVIYLLALAKYLQPYDAKPSTQAEPDEPGTSRQRVLSPEEAEVRHMLHSLREKKAAAEGGPSDDKKADKGRASPSIPPPPDQVSPELRAVWEELVERHDRSNEQNHFEVLGVSENATTDEIKVAFLPLIKKWHPDRLPSELSDLRPWADRYFHRINQAHDTLSNPKKRADYVASLKGELDEEQETVDRTLRAAMDFRKVEVLMKRKLWTEAEELLEQVLELDASDPDYLVARATIMFRRLRGKAAKAELKKIKDVLDKAFDIHQEHADGWYLRGEVYEREEDSIRALNAFKKVLEIQPRHLQATRKVRLANMRTRKESSVQGDLLGRFFGKKK